MGESSRTWFHQKSAESKIPLPASTNSSCSMCRLIFRLTMETIHAVIRLLFEQNRKADKGPKHYLNILPYTKRWQRIISPLTTAFTKRMTAPVLSQSECLLCMDIALNKYNEHEAEKTFKVPILKHWKEEQMQLKARSYCKNAAAYRFKGFSCISIWILKHSHISESTHVGQ